MSEETHTHLACMHWLALRPSDCLPLRHCQSVGQCASDRDLPMQAGTFETRSGTRVTLGRLRSVCATVFRTIVWSK